jgi:hypothetical protein
MRSLAEPGALAKAKPNLRDAFANACWTSMLSLATAAGLNSFAVVNPHVIACNSIAL